MAIPGYRRIGDDPIHDEMLRKLHLFSWPILNTVADTAPTIDTLDTGWAQFFDDGTNRRIYVNLTGTIYYWGLTAA